MKTLNALLLAGTIGLLGSAAYAKDHNHGQFHQQRLERLQIYLQLKPDQQDAWKAFAETAQEPEHKKGKDGHDKASAKTAPERFDHYIQRLKNRLQRAEAKAVASKKLYQVLTPDQRKVMDEFYQRPHHGKRCGGKRGHHGH